MSTLTELDTALQHQDTAEENEALALANISKAISEIFKYYQKNPPIQGNEELNKCILTLKTAVTDVDQAVEEAKTAKINVKALLVPHVYAPLESPQKKSGVK